MKLDEIDDGLIDELSCLAALEFDNDEKETIKNDLKNIISFLDKISEIDTEGVEPLKYLNEAITFSYRDDVEKIPLSQKKALLNAKNTKGGFFISPKVLT